MIYIKVLSGDQTVNYVARDDDSVGILLQILKWLDDDKIVERDDEITETPDESEKTLTELFRERNGIEPICGSAYPSIDRPHYIYD